MSATETAEGRESRGRPCSMAAALSAIGEKWSLLAIREISLGNHRFSQIVLNTGAPRDRLAARLKSLEADGIIERRPYGERPVRHEYHLTPAGRGLLPVLTTLRTWGDRWANDGQPDHQPPITFHHGTDEHEVRPELACQTCGERLRFSEIHGHVHAPGWTIAGPGDPSA